MFLFITDFKFLLLLANSGYSMQSHLYTPLFAHFNTVHPHETTDMNSLTLLLTYLLFSSPSIPPSLMYTLGNHLHLFIRSLDTMASTLSLSTPYVKVHLNLLFHLFHPIHSPNQTSSSFNPLSSLVIDPSFTCTQQGMQQTLLLYHDVPIHTTFLSLINLLINFSFYIPKKDIKNYLHTQ